LSGGFELLDLPRIPERRGSLTFIEGDNGFEKGTVHLHRPHRGLLLRPTLWRTIDSFSGGTLCPVIVEFFPMTQSLAAIPREIDQASRPALTKSPTAHLRDRPEFAVAGW